MHLGPPPLVVPVRRPEDVGSRSEDESLPHSPSETSGAPSKVTQGTHGQVSAYLIRANQFNSIWEKSCKTFLIICVFECQKCRRFHFRFLKIWRFPAFSCFILYETVYPLNWKTSPCILINCDGHIFWHLAQFQGVFFILWFWEILLSRIINQTPLLFTFHQPFWIKYHLFTL